MDSASLRLPPAAATPAPICCKCHLAKKKKENKLTQSTSPFDTVCRLAAYGLALFPLPRATLHSRLIDCQVVASGSLLPPSDGCSLPHNARENAIIHNMSCPKLIIGYKLSPQGLRDPELPRYLISGQRYSICSSLSDSLLYCRHCWPNILVGN